MRDPQRIKRILGKLEQAWTAAPDLRFGQLMECILSGTGDRFILEDDKTEAAIDKWLADSHRYFLSPNKEA